MDQAVSRAYNALLRLREECAKSVPCSVASFLSQISGHVVTQYPLSPHQAKADGVPLSLKTR